MLTGKQRSYLKALANKRHALIQLGKEGITEAFVRQLDALFEHHELVKITILETCGVEDADIIERLCADLDAQFVQHVGRKLTLYRQSRTNPLLEIPGADNRRVQVNLQKKRQSQIATSERTNKRGGKISRPFANKKKGKAPEGGAGRGRRV